MPQKNASFELIKKPQLNEYTLGVHVIRRMDERFVSPIKFLSVVNEGIQVRSVNEPHKIYIKRKSLVIVVDNREYKFLTVMRDTNFADLNEIGLVRERENHKNGDINKVKEIKLKYLRNFNTVEELKTHLNITEEDYREDERRIKNNKRSYVENLLNIISSLEQKFSTGKVFNEDLKSAFSQYWDSPIIKNKGTLITMPLNKTWSLNFKTLHGQNLSGSSNKESWAKEIKEIMKKPIIVLRYDDTHYILDGSHRYNEASTKNEYRLNPEEDYKLLPIFLVALEEKDQELDSHFFEWLTKKRIPNGNWS